MKKGFWYHVIGKPKVGFTLFLIGAVLFASYAIGHSQSTKKMFRIVALVPGASLTRADEAFREGLRTLGYLEGQNIAIDWRVPKAIPESIPDLLLRRSPLK